MTDVRELIERGRYTAQHGVFDAVDACKYATVAELTDALSAALEREEALRVALEPFAQLSRRKANYVIRPNDPAVLEAVHALES